MSHRHQTHEHNACLEACLVIFFPPLSVWVHQGECSSHVLINFLIGFFTFGTLGIVHAFWFCFIRDDDCVLCRSHDHNTVIIVDRQFQPAANPVHCDRSQCAAPPPPSQQNQMHSSAPIAEGNGHYDQPPPAYDETPYAKRRPEDD